MFTVPDVGHFVRINFITVAKTHTRIYLNETELMNYGIFSQAQLMEFVKGYFFVGVPNII